MLTKLHAEALLALMAELYMALNRPDPEPQPEPAAASNGAGHVDHLAEVKVSGGS